MKPIHALVLALLALSGCASRPARPEPFGLCEAWPTTVDVDGRAEVRYAIGRPDGARLLGPDYAAHLHVDGRYLLREVGSARFDEYTAAQGAEEGVVDELVRERSTPYDAFTTTWYTPLLGGGGPRRFRVGVIRPEAELRPELGWPRGTAADVLLDAAWSRSLRLTEVARHPIVLEGGRLLVEHHAGEATRWLVHDSTGQPVGPALDGLGWTKVRAADERWIYYVVVDGGLLQPLSASGELFLARVPGLRGCSLELPDPTAPDVADGLWLAFDDGRFGWLAADARWGQDTGSGPLWREVQRHTAESQGHRLQTFLGRTDEGWSVWEREGLRRVDAPPSATVDEARAVALAACEARRQQVVAELAAAEQRRQELRGEVLRCVRAGDLFGATVRARSSEGDGDNLFALIALASPVDASKDLDAQANAMLALCYHATDRELAALLADKAKRVKAVAAEHRAELERTRQAREYAAYLERERQVDALSAEKRFGEARDLAWQTSPQAIARVVLAAREAGRLGDMTDADISVARDRTSGHLMRSLRAEIERRNAPPEATYSSPPSAGGWSTSASGLSQQQQDFYYTRELNRSIWGTDHDPYE